MFKFNSRISHVNVLFLTLFIQMIQGEVYRWCDPYETFCLFSYGPDVTVSNLTEAQQLCTDFKNGSLLVNISNSQIKDRLTQFIANNSLGESAVVCSIGKLLKLMIVINITNR